MYLYETHLPVSSTERSSAFYIDAVGLCFAYRDPERDIGWMPSAQLYFCDLDGHTIEFIALLDEEPDPSFIGSLTEWQRRAITQRERAEPPPAL